MGKDLKGKELGTGISQRKDGYYVGRYTDRYGKRRQKCFKKLQECRRWVVEEPEVSVLSIELSNNTVDIWFNYWINLKKNLKSRTIDRYKDRYNIDVKPMIGRLKLRDVKPIHCQMVLDAMDERGCATGTMENTRNLMTSVFLGALENDLIAKSPITKNVQVVKRRKKERRVLTISEQKEFILAAKKTNDYTLFGLALQTGMRVGELAGLRWSDIDYERNVIHVRRSVWKSASTGWVEDTTKSEAGERDIPMTKEAISLLALQREKTYENNMVDMRWRDLVFKTSNGKPKSQSSLWKALSKICNNAGIERISMHTLRHTFATRCIEAGMLPKTLQTILGHSKIEMTMNLYVHSTEEHRQAEIKMLEERLAVV